MASELLVVLDANVYVHAALELDDQGWTPDWATAPSTLEQASLNGVAAIAGRLPTLEEPLVSVYSSSAIDDLVLRKLAQPADPELPEHERGLGFSDAHAERLYRELAQAIDATGRSFSIDPPPGEAPLPGADYEDRCVWGLFRAAMSDRPDAAPILVTNDRAFALQVNAEATRSRGNRPPWLAVSAARCCEILVRSL